MSSRRRPIPAWRFHGRQARTVGLPVVPVTLKAFRPRMSHVHVTAPPASACARRENTKSRLSHSTSNLTVAMYLIRYIVNERFILMVASPLVEDADPC